MKTAKLLIYDCRFIKFNEIYLEVYVIAVCIGFWKTEFLHWIVPVLEHFRSSRKCT